MAKDRPAATRRILAVALPMLVALGVALVVLNGEDAAKPDALMDGDLCAVDGGGLAASATLLLDLRKPLPGGFQPGLLLRRLSRDLAAGTELRAFALTGAPGSPRRFLARLCKPYEDSELSIESAKDQRREQRDCDDLPAQLPPHLRTLAEGFCVRRAALANRMAGLARSASPPPVANAYLIEAIEAAKQEFRERPPPWSLYLFSDMLQHASWYSHLDLDWTEWRFADFQGLRAVRATPLPSWTAGADLNVKVFYAPRQGLTDAPRAKRAHQAFWRAYFGAADLVFEEQPPQPAYAALPLMDALAQREREETERLLAQLAERRAALEGQRQQGLAAQQERAARAAELNRLEQEIQAARTRQQQAQQQTQEAQTAQEARTAQEVQEAQDVQEAGEGGIFGEEPSAGEREGATPRMKEPSAGEREGATPRMKEPSAGEREGAGLAGADPSAEQRTGATLAGAETSADQRDREPPSAPPPLTHSRDDHGFTDPNRQSPAAGTPPAQPSCAASLKPAFSALLVEDSYFGNRRVNYGAGVIGVLYNLDEDGQTRDEAVLLDRDQSNNTRPASFEALAEDTLAQVRAWEFDFADPAAPGCVKTERRTATFTYRNKCVGAPAPSCRTVLAEVDVH